MFLRIAAGLLLVSLTMFAQQETPPRRPRVGLVLSGGSALGLTHVGVIQWLEEHRIPVDLVAGTSMGGLVGGLYASGADSREMREFVRDTDWSAVFSTTAPFYDLSYRRKEDRREFPNILELGLKHGLSLPTGLLSGQEVGFVIGRFAAPYAELRSFDDLPIPFRCVATDLILGESVVLSDGDLATALRATMSLPAVFAPVPYGNRLLVDGGLLNNLPVDVGKTMGADIVIAVQLIDPPAGQGSIMSLLGVASRSMSIVIDNNAKQNAALADILIAPDYQNLSSSAFGKFEEFEQRGYAAAEKIKDRLLPLALTEDAYRQYVNARNARKRPLVFTPETVEVVGPSAQEAQEIIETYGEPLIGKPVDSAEVDDALNRLVGRGVYQSAAYGFIQKDGKNVLRIHTIPKPNAPPFINTGVNISGSEAGDTHFGFGARLTFLNAGVPGAEWRTDFTLGLNNSVTSEYYWLLGGRFFVAPRAFASKRREDLYVGNDRLFDLSVRDIGAGADIGIGGGQFSEIRFGYVFDNFKLRVTTGIPIEGFENQHVDIHAMRLRWSWDSQDSSVIPRRGIRSVAEARWNSWRSGDPSRYGTIEERFSMPKSFGKQYILIGSAAAGAVLGPEAPIPPFSLGGPGRMNAFGIGQLRGDRYYYGSLAGFRAFSADPTSSLNRTYLTAGFETGSAFRDASNHINRYDGFLGVASETPVGALLFGGAWGSQSNKRFFFSLGRIF